MITSCSQLGSQLGKNVIIMYYKNNNKCITLHRQCNAQTVSSCSTTAVAHKDQTSEECVYAIRKLRHDFMNTVFVNISSKTHAISWFCILEIFNIITVKKIINTTISI